MKIGYGSVLTLGERDKLMAGAFDNGKGNESSGHYDKEELETEYSGREEGLALVTHSLLLVLQNEIKLESNEKGKNGLNYMYIRPEMHPGKTNPTISADFRDVLKISEAFPGSISADRGLYSVNRDFPQKYGSSAKFRHEVALFRLPIILGWDLIGVGWNTSDHESGFPGVLRLHITFHPDRWGWLFTSLDI